MKSKILMWLIWKGETDNKDISQIIELLLKELGINQSDNIDIQILEYKIRFFVE